MNDTEERIRAAARAAAATVRETPPLDLLRDVTGSPAGSLAGSSAGPGRREPSAGRREPWAGRIRRVRAWGAPLAAAAAVLAIAASVAAVRDLPRGGHPGPAVSSTCAASPSASPAASPAATAHAVAPVAGVPAYYVTLDDASAAAGSGPATDACPYRAVVAGTFTGARLATVDPPAGSTFAGVTGAADDRTFVLDATTCSKPDAASQVCPRTWYRLRVDPGGSDTARLTRLPIPATAAGTRVEAMALSPDGRELAVALQPDASGSGAPESLVLYSTATGAVLRTWTGPNGTIYTPGQWFRVDSVNATLSWLPNGRALAFGDELAIRTLDTTSRGRNLISDSTLIWTYKDLAGDPRGYQLSCEGGEYVIDVGTSLVCGATGMPAPARHLTSECSDMWDNAMGFLAYSTATRRFTRALYIDQTTCTGEVTAVVYWASRSGGTVIGLLNSAPERHPAARQRNQVAVISGGRVTTLPIPLASGYPMLGATAW